MRPFALGMTAYLVGYHILYFVTRGAFQSPDTVSDVYFFVLATYAGAPEIRRWARQDPTDPEGLNEQIRKGGPLITLWFLLWAGVVLWRIYDPSMPMPPELKSITLQVMGLFFGTYALRQARRRSTGASRTENPSQPPAENAVFRYLQASGPCSPKAIRETLGLPRRTVTRELSRLLSEGRITRKANSPQDPEAVYSVI